VFLFLCRGNSYRSQIPKLRRRLANRTAIYSAGTMPEEIHPLAAHVIKEAGVDIAGQRSKGLEAIPLERVGMLITLCGECPALARPVRRAHWPLADPALARGTEEEILAAFRSVRDEIRARVEELFSRPRRAL
jgi:arsenate reductase